jgi:predicted cobalt transporter CbtA
MKIVFAAAIVAMLAGPALAQSQDKMPTMEQMMDAKTPDQVEKERAADQAYKESLKKIPDAKTSSDPWGSARGADAPKPTASGVAKTPKKPTAKAGNAVN